VNGTVGQCGSLGGITGANGTSKNGANGGVITGDSSAPGAGGGGYIGGTGGSAPSCDAYGTGGGGGGTSYGITINNGSGITPGNSGSSLRGTAGNGGSGSSASGNSGVVVITYPTGVFIVAGCSATTVSGSSTNCIFTSSGVFTAYTASTPLVAATGGTVVDANGYRTHTFTSNGTLSITSGGNIIISVSGAGGGGGGGGMVSSYTGWCWFAGDDWYEYGDEWSCMNDGGEPEYSTYWSSGTNGSSGLDTYISRNSVNYFAYSGGGGSGTSGSGGIYGVTNNPVGWMSGSGGGRSGGIGSIYSNSGGPGGIVFNDSIAVSAGQSITVVIGSGGAGSSGATAGSNGLVTIKYVR